ncbi:MAG TPA: ThuA domain-containing protein [Candidatus Methylacidiphilales bacterium]|nr:ThuA domain-containing protein [Candidatus Methylacidiphilales bacterium]
MKPPFHHLILSVSLAAAFTLSPCAMALLRAEPGHVFPPLKTEELARITSALPKEPRVKPAKPRRILVFYRTEGYVHASIAHANETFKQLGEKTGAFSVEISEDMAAFEPDNLKKFDAVLLNNTTGLKMESPAQRQALLDFVIKDGKGLIGIHAATDNFGKWPEGQALMGGSFKGHPWGAGDISAIKLDEPEHPVVKAFGGKGFWLREELYQISGPYSRDKQRVLISLDMSRPENRRDPAKIERKDNDFPVAWVKKTEAGRVFYSSFGHNPDVFMTPEIVQHFLDGIQFALGDLPADSIPSAQLVKQPVPALAPTAIVALQDIPRKPNADQYDAWLKALASYDLGGDRESVAALQDYLRYADAQGRAKGEADILPLLGAASTPYGARDTICRWLGLIGTARSVPALEKLLTEEKLANPAVYALIEIPGAEADAALMRYLEKAPDDIRPAVIGAVGRRRIASAVPALAKLAGSTKKPEAIAALNALGAIGSAAALDALIKLHVPEDDQVTLNWAIHASAAQLVMSKNKSENDLAFNQLKTLALNNNAGSSLRVAAATAIIRSGEPQALEVVLPLLHDPDARVAANVAAVAPGIQNKDVAQVLSTAMATLTPQVQAVLVRSFATRQDATAQSIISKGLDSADADVRGAAILALGNSRDAAMVDQLIGLLAKNDNDGKAATEALKRCAAPSAGEQIRNALGKSQGPARAALLLVVADRLDALATDAAVTATTDDDDSVRGAASAALEKLAREQDLPKLIELLNTQLKANERKSLEKALLTSSRAFKDADQPAEKMQKALTGATPEGRRILIVGLASLGSPKASAALASMLQAPEVDARKEVIRALSSSRAPFVVTLLLDACKNAKEPSERILALRGYLDTVQDQQGPADTKVDLYQAAWPLAERQEEKDVIIGGLKKIGNNKSRKLLETLAPETPKA